MSTILIGVDATERSADAIAFGRRLAAAAEADIVVACVFPYSDTPSRASNAAYRTALRDEARKTAREMRDQLGDIAERAQIRIAANPSPAHALHDMAAAERAALVVVGSTHTGRSGRVLPCSTGERLLHGASCSVAVVPTEYRAHAGEPIRRIGVAYNNTPEARSAVAAAVELARSLGAELEIVAVVDAASYGTPALMGGPSTASRRQELERHVQDSLDEMVGGIPADVSATGTRLVGEPPEQLAEHSAGLDLLVTGSRGYGPLRAVLTGGVSGRLLRSAQCPVIVVPRGVEAPLGSLFGATTTTAA